MRSKIMISHNPWHPVGRRFECTPREITIYDLVSCCAVSPEYSGFSSLRWIYNPVDNKAKDCNPALQNL